MAFLTPIKIQRPCNGCTKCCEGFLSGEAYGYKFKLGTPCKFKNSAGCGIYSVRPYSPCQTFSCYWKDNHFVPENLKPSVSGVIMVERYLENYKYLDINYAGREVSPEVEDFLYQLYIGKKVENIRYISKGKYKLLSDNPTFKSLFIKTYGSENVI